VCPSHYRYHKLTLTLLKASWRRAQQLVASRADAIRGVAAALLAADDERLEGPALVEVIEVRGQQRVHLLDTTES
jgi:cell division protease FtsH